MYAFAKKISAAFNEILYNRTLVKLISKSDFTLQKRTYIDIDIFQIM